MKQALLVIDAQQELMDGGPQQQGVYEKDKVINNINRVIEQALKKKVHIVFIRDKDVSNGKGSGFQVHKDISIPLDAVIFDKEATNSFYGTPLLEYLNEKNIQHLVIMGCQSEYCIDTAVRTATVHHFDVTLVGDGHSTVDSKILSAKQIIQHHNETLHGHYNVDHFSIVRNADEDLFTPTHNTYR
ncbi:isochorismatase family protein [Rummeliibacillus suwonensis]|uniref:isochorismatase family protein n=1 Tax=Rummeliibacillus suwonensis TaxID=1306154 RepID=UPI0011B7BB6C|nr:isochorismatase family protein [Rummeliibacillus suwonensis]MBO2536780.1 isochorismatase family protein [Rummeliibacillus suwonensis]